MKVFITGASGYIGFATALAFRRKGHQVWGLIRSETHKAKLLKHEITPVMGDIGNLSSLKGILDGMQVIVHTAFELSETGIQKDSQAIDAICNIGKSTTRPMAFLYTSGTWVYGNTKEVLDESSELHSIELSRYRAAHEELVLRANSPHFKTLIIRPGVVFGGSGSLTAFWFEAAKKGEVPIVGDGSNYWAMVHRDDLAKLYLLSAEKELGGMVLNATDGSYHTVREMAEAVAKVAGCPGKVRSLSVDVAQKLYGPLWEGLAIDQKISSERAKRLLGWQVDHLPFTEEVATYFASCLA